MLSDRCLSCLSVLSVTLLYRPIVAKRLLDQDSTWYGGMPRPWRHCVPGPSSPKRGGGGALQLPHLSANVLLPNGWMDQDATWYGARLVAV